jgi:murein L,D-transpeptidase YcbB/YkuD
MSVEQGRVVQAAGPDAALGAVKFDMQNRYAIYLHDTPSKALFSRPERFFSHGCVRVEHAVDLARLIARDSGVEDRFNAALKSRATKVVALGRQVPVRLMYLTAFSTPSGTVEYRADPYEWDARVAEALRLEGPKSHAPSIPLDLSLGP